MADRIRTQPEIIDPALADRTARRMFLAFLSLDMVFVAIHLVLKGMLHAGLEVSPALWPRMDLGKEWGVPECFNYLKWAIAVVLLGMTLARRFRIPTLCLFLVTLLLLGDDSGRFHERAGHWLARRVDGDGPFGLRWQDVGELGYWVLQGIAVFAVLTLAYLRASDRAKGPVRVFILSILGLIAFGVGLDLVHSAIKHPGWLIALLATGEDGGELVFISLASSAAAALAFREGARR